MRRFLVVLVLAGMPLRAQVQIPETPYKVGNGVSAPTLIFKVEPEYTEVAREAGFQGPVRLQLVVRPDGTASEIQVTRSLGLGLDEKAVEAIQKWRFKPGEKEGHPVPVIAVVQVNFRLLDPPPSDVQSFEMKPGKYEVTTTRLLDVPVKFSAILPTFGPRMLRGMTSDDAIKIDQSNGEHIETSTTQASCFTNENLSRIYYLAPSSAKSCTRKITLSSATRREMGEECATPEYTMHALVKFEAASPYTFSASREATSLSRGGMSMRVRTTVSAKWIGDSCDGQK